ncbi:MAG: hypothetical protein LBC97_01715 [Bifidobacteriaceae bacterium]|jgi:alternate signal-mediated exported protein|nr:hypothetical protein [Bifidobacteriaceae bacterium]
MTINPQTERERRSRRFKGLVAGAAGVALLLGGGTFAMWSDSALLGTGSSKITHGELKLTGTKAESVKVYDLRGTGTGAWTDIDGDGNSTEIPNVGDFLAVPGDRLEFQLGKVTVGATGNHMEWDLGMAPTTQLTTADLKGWTVTGYVLTDANAVVASGEIDLTTATPSTIAAGKVDTAVTYKVAVVAEFDKGDTTYNNKGGDNYAFVLAHGFTVKVQQVDPFAAN